jgi:putative transposase
MSRKSRAKPSSPFRYFNSSPEVIRLVVMMYVRFPLSLRNVEDLLAERRHRHLPRDGTPLVEQVRSDVCCRHPAPARVSRMRGLRQWQWHVDEMYVKLNSEMVYL